MKRSPFKFSHTPLLRDDFGKPIILDTREFRLLNYGLEQIYSRVNEEDYTKVELCRWKKDRITHLEAESMNAQLHNKFRGG